MTHALYVAFMNESASGFISFQTFPTNYRFISL